jgi:CBS domain containing-hemolysin-like protein
LFHTFRKGRLSLALAVDEYGGLTGMVTMEDLLEVIFGDIPSGSDAAQQDTVEFAPLGPGEYRLDGAIRLEQLRRELEVELAGGGAETVGGLLLQEFGELPSSGARAVIEGVEFVVTKVADRRIQEVVARTTSGRPQSVAPRKSDDPNRG